MLLGCHVMLIFEVCFKLNALINLYSSSTSSFSAGVYQYRSNSGMSGLIRNGVFIYTFLTGRMVFVQSSNDHFFP